jgi:hypothetical protein
MYKVDEFGLALEEIAMNRRNTPLYDSEATIKRKSVINSPSHYNSGKIEVIAFLEDQKLGFHAGNVVKYVCRAPHKNGLEDLKKAQWYLNRLISILEKSHD